MLELTNIHPKESQDIEDILSLIIKGWHGENQNFGQTGNSQQCVNIVGSMGGPEASGSSQDTVKITVRTMVAFPLIMKP